MGHGAGSGGVEVRVLGLLQVLSGGAVIELTGDRQQRAVLALAAAGPDGSSTGSLAEAIWDDVDRPADSTSHVRTLISRLRSRLANGDPDAGAAIAGRPGGYRFDDDLVTVDLWQFERALEAARAEADPRHRRHLLDAALPASGQDPYAMFAEFSGLTTEAARRTDRWLDAEQDRLELWLADGNQREVIDRCEQLLRVSPYRERLRSTEVLALYRDGRQAEALRRLDKHRAMMIEDLGLRPAPEITDLEAKILNQDETLLHDRPVAGWIRGYVLGEELSRDDKSVVHVAQQPSIGRSVTVEVVNASYANEPAFMRQFEAEAQRFAKLEHPSLVPLYDYWREPDRACLVFPALRSRSLLDHLGASGPLTRAQARRLVSQIGSALSAVHDAGLGHGSIDASAIFVDKDENYLLGRFPIAARALRSAPDDLAALLERDIDGLNRVVAEVLALGSMTSGGFGPTRLDGLAPTGIDHPQAVGGGSVGRAVASLIDALGDPPTGRSEIDSQPADRATNPYQGLRAFTEADRGAFFGREDLIEEMLEVLNRNEASKVLAIVGPSGIGKSSTVMAGLVPSVRSGRLRCADHWFVTSMTPGREPFDELAAALLRVSTSTSAVAKARLRQDRDGLARAVASLLRTPKSGLLLVIDQFEELFDDGIDRDERQRFLDALEATAAATDERFRVVLTIRADHWDRPLRHPRFAALIADSAIHVPAMAPTELERAIVQPALASGVAFEDGLVATLVADIADQAGGLPWVQLTLAELWDRMPLDSSMITLASYGDLGGVAGAAAKIADEVYEGFDAAGRRRTRSVFGRLATRRPSGSDTRRRVLRANLGADQLTAEILERFGSARLLSFDHDPHSRDPLVEIAHDAFLDGWPRLQGWLEEDRANLAVAERLVDAAAAWLAGGCDEGDLYRGGRLEALDAWLAERGCAEFSAVEIDFIDASLAARDAAQEAERARLSRLRRGLMITAAVAVIAVAATVVAFYQRRSAVAVAYRSDTLIMVREAERLAQTDPNLALQLAVTAVSRDDGPMTQSALVATLAAEPRFDGVVARLGEANCWDWAPSSEGPSPLLVGEPTAGSVRSVSLISASGRTQGSRTVPATPGCPRLDPSGDRALVVGNDGLGIVSFSGEADVELELPVTLAAWAADGSAIVSLGRTDVAGKPWQLRVHDPADLSVETALEVDTVSPIAIDYASASSRALILESGVGGRRSSIVDVDTQGQVQLEHRAELRNAMMSSDGRFAVGVDDRQLHVWETASGQREASVTLVGDGSLSTGLAVSPNGAVAAVATGAGVEVYSLETGEVSAPFGVSGPLRFEGETRLLVAKADGLVLAYDLERGRVSRRVFDWDHSLGIVAPDGSVALTGTADDAVGFDLRTGESFGVPTIDARAAVGGRITGYDSDRRQYYLMENGDVTVRSDVAGSVPDGLVNMRMPRTEYDRVLIQLFDPGDGQMATNRLLVLAAESGEVVDAFPVPGVYLSEFLSRDEILVARQGGTVQIVKTDGTVADELPPFGAEVSAGDSGTSTATQIVLGLRNGTTVVWSRAEERVIETLIGPASFVVHVLPIEDGVIIQHASGEILQWRWGIEEPIAQLVAPGDFGGLAHLSPSGAEIIVPIDRGIEAFPVSATRWREEACARLSPTIDGDGWRAATGLDPPESIACD